MEAQQCRSRSFFLLSVVDGCKAPSFWGRWRNANGSPDWLRPIRSHRFRYRKSREKFFRVDIAQRFVVLRSRDFRQVKRNDCVATALPASSPARQILLSRSLVERHQNLVLCSLPRLDSPESSPAVNIFLGTPFPKSPSSTRILSPAKPDRDLVHRDRLARPWALPPWRRRWSCTTNSLTVPRHTYVVARRHGDNH